MVPEVMAKMDFVNQMTADIIKPNKDKELREILFSLISLYIKVFRDLKFNKHISRLISQT